jgi:hypothetical protein
MGPEVARDAGYWRDIMSAEYEGLPRLSLTVPQARRLWGLDERTCRYVLDSFVETGYLLRTPDGRYGRADQPWEIVDSGNIACEIANRSAVSRPPGAFPTTSGR